MAEQTNPLPTEDAGNKKYMDVACEWKGGVKCVEKYSLLLVNFKDKYISKEKLRM